MKAKLAILLLLIATIAYAHTDDTTVGRLQLIHPDLGHEGGAALHTKVRNAWTKIADNMNSRYFTVDDLADSANTDFTHNFKAAFEELQFLLYSWNTGTGELTRITGATSPSINDFVIEATPGNLTTQVRVTNNSGGSQDLALIAIHNGGGGAAGGGGSITWMEPEGSAPVLDNEFGHDVYLFDTESNLLRAMVKVPEGYQGSQINMKIGLYSPSTSNTILLKANVYLIRPGTDGINSSANSHVTTNTALTNGSPANAFRVDTLDLTTAAGEINSIAVTSGDLLIVELFRGSDTDTADIRFVPGTTEVSFQ